MAEDKKKAAIKELLYKMADDQLIIGHRNSEWTGLGPVLEEDIAFSSLAQDKVGHAYNIYQLLNEMGEGVPDKIAFNRAEEKFKCCHLVEHPIGEYDFSLVRHFFFDHAELIRFEMLIESTFKPIADLAKKYRGEIKYHVFHANTWISQLAKGNEESKNRIQSAINNVFPLALGIFEQSEFEDILISEGIFKGEEALKDAWYIRIKDQVEKSGLSIPPLESSKAELGGRKGYHTEHLKALLDEMSEVFKLDPEAEW